MIQFFCYNNRMDGFIFLNKNTGLTSREVCDLVSKKLNHVKVGHVGTLDPFASGLLLLMINKGTRCAQFFDDFDKGYIATLFLGEYRDSLDITGEIIKKENPPKLDEKQIINALNSFLGKSLQTPPMTSAVHVNGKKLYELAHRGIEIERPAREIEVFDIKLLSYKDNEITFYVKVSKGTYIRVLGSDIALKLGTIGYLSSLKRVEVGPFKIEDTIDIEKIIEDKIISIYDVLSRFCYLKEVDSLTATDIKNGKIKYLEDVSEHKYLLVIEENKSLVAMYKKNKENIYEFTRGLFS